MLTVYFSSGDLTRVVTRRPGMRHSLDCRFAQVFGGEANGSLKVRNQLTPFRPTTPPQTISGCLSFLGTPIERLYGTGNERLPPVNIRL